MLAKPSIHALNIHKLSVHVFVPTHPWCEKEEDTPAVRQTCIPQKLPRFRGAHGILDRPRIRFPRGVGSRGQDRVLDLMDVANKAPTGRCGPTEGHWRT